MSIADPFFSVRDEVLGSLKNAQSLFTRWKELYGTANTDEFQWTTEELKNTLKSIEWDLEDLGETIGIVEANPSKFNLTAADVEKRREFVKDTNSRLKEMKDAMQSAKLQAEKEAREKLLMKKNQQQAVASNQHDRFAKLDQHLENENNTFINSQAQAQQQIVRRQDNILDEVAKSVARLKQHGQVIADELDEQNQELDRLDEAVDHTSGKLAHAIKRVDHVLHITKDKKQSCTICILIVVLIVMIILFSAIK